MGAQVRALLNGVDVLVATPGRLLDLVHSNALRLNGVEVFVLDEADRMLDMGFIHDIRKIVGKLPTERQTLLFSATMPSDIAELARAHAERSGQGRRSRRPPPRSSASPSASSMSIASAKPTLLTEMLRQEPVDRVLVFTRTKHGADKVVRGLQQRRHQRRGDPRQQVAEPARARARELPQRRASACWSPPTSRRAASMSTASATSSTSTCRTSRRATCTASAAPRAPAPKASRSRSARHEELPFLRDIEKLIRMAIPATGQAPRPAQRAPQQQTRNGRGAMAEPQQSKPQWPAAATGRRAAAMAATAQRPQRTSSRTHRPQSAALAQSKRRSTARRTINSVRISAQPRITSRPVACRQAMSPGDLARVAFMQPR